MVADAKVVARHRPPGRAAVIGVAGSRCCMIDLAVSVPNSGAMSPRVATADEADWTRHDGE